MKSLHLLYHELRPEQSHYSYVIECSQFDRHCELFAKVRSNPGQSLLPVITFDDGHRSNYEYALPLLKGHGLDAHFFVTVGWIGARAQCMGWDELRALHSAGQTIGAHGWSHTLLTHCSAGQLKQELTDARHKLEDELGDPVTTMSLPGGRFNRNVLNTCWTAGYTEVFTSTPRPERVERTSPATVGRLNLRSSATPQWIEQVLQPNSGLLAKLQRQEQIKSAARTLLGDGLYAKIWSLVNREEREPDSAGVRAE